MSLETRTRALDAAETDTLSLSDLKRIQQADREVIGSGLYETAISAGMMVPGFALRADDGETLSLPDLLDTGPLVLSFNRGNWCGYCRLELDALERARDTLSTLGAQIVSITPQSVAANRLLREELGLGFPILSDPGARVASLFGIAYRLPEDLQEMYTRAGLNLPALNAAKGEACWKIPVPATYLIARDGSVAYAFFDANYRNRLDPDELIDALKALGG